MILEFFFTYEAGFWLLASSSIAQTLYWSLSHLAKTDISRPMSRDILFIPLAILSFVGLILSVIHFVTAFVDVL